jgi:NAD(P)-dependent dehydrogenase (short-subunit alcohol dehydrogenase family)
MNITVQNQVALATGAASGLGLTTAKAFAESCAPVALADWNENARRAAAENLAAKGHKVVAIRCDVADDAQVDDRADGRNVRSPGRGLQQRRCAEPARREQKAPIVQRAVLIDKTRRH